MVVRMRNTRSQRGNRRSQISLQRSARMKCPECGSIKTPHKMCDNCGKYKGRVVVDVYAGLAKKEEKKKNSSESKKKEDSSSASSDGEKKEKKAK